MGEILTFIFWTVFMLFIYPGIVFVICTIINRDDVDDWRLGCPQIYTIGDLIDAMHWRVKHTSAEVFCIPFVNTATALCATLVGIVIVLLLSIKWLLEKLNLLVYIKEFGKFISKQWNKFKNITIFKYGIIHQDVVKNK